MNRFHSCIRTSHKIACMAGIWSKYDFFACFVESVVESLRSSHREVVCGFVYFSIAKKHFLFFEWYSRYFGNKFVKQLDAFECVTSKLIVFVDVESRQLWNILCRLHTIQKVLACVEKAFSLLSGHRSRSCTLSLRPQARVPGRPEYPRSSISWAQRQAVLSLKTGRPHRRGRLQIGFPFGVSCPVATSVSLCGFHSTPRLSFHFEHLHCDRAACLLGWKCDGHYY